MMFQTRDGINLSQRIMAGLVIQQQKNEHRYNS